MNEKDDDLFVEGAKRLKQLIQDRNLKQIDIVNALEVSRDTVSQWLHGSTVPAAQSLMELARFLAVTERWILEGKGRKSADQDAPHIQPDNAVHLQDASVEQLMAEIKARYAALNLKAEIKISVQPLEGGFVTRE
ncbi:helix-turn-helix domain-containing protein [Acinetobacter sp. WZC-1]|uniref:helix-turn-helix domain-containing protein n=1 Tax=Acinetobacter sp. WZC-1 TaxID=3459034 RepID=UPI00403D5A59